MCLHTRWDEARVGVGLEPWASYQVGWGMWVVGQMPWAPWEPGDAGPAVPDVWAKAHEYVHATVAVSQTQ